MIKVRNLSKQFSDGAKSSVVINQLGLDIDSGQSVSITGESGCGKSTLLHLLSGLEKPDSGTIEIDKQDISHFNEQQLDAFRKRHFGIVFQRFNLIDCLNVWDNVCLPARLNNNVNKGFILDLLDALNLRETISQFPTTLSGGQQQRVALVRALTHRPKIVFADEPTGNLDEKNSQVVTQLLYDLCEQQSTTLVLVTHSQSIAAQAQKQMYLKNGQLQPPLC